MKRPNPSNLEDRQPVSDEDNEAVVKRPKLIEADESQSMQDNHAPASSEVNIAVYVQDCRGIAFEEFSFVLMKAKT